MQHKLKSAILAAFLLSAFVRQAQAADTIVIMQKATPNGAGETIGTVTIGTSSAGVTFKLDLHGLPPGPHGFHVHENADCYPTMMNGVRIPAGAAGMHYDPDNTGKHAGPEGDGHMGDLPVLQADADGTAHQTLTARRINNADILKKHALIIHFGGDNYEESPLALGGGGGRLACGVVQ